MRRDIDTAISHYVCTLRFFHCFNSTKMMFIIILLIFIITRITVVAFVASSNTRNQRGMRAVLRRCFFVCCGIAWTQGLTIGRHCCPSR
jgi:hypothetical protein